MSKRTITIKSGRNPNGSNGRRISEILSSMVVAEKAEAEKQGCQRRKRLFRRVLRNVEGWLI